MKKTKFEDIELKVLIEPIKIVASVTRGYTYWHPLAKSYITLVLGNIAKDLDDINDVDEWARAIDAVYLIEFMCGSFLQNWATVVRIGFPCLSYKDCPFRVICNKIGYKYEINEEDVLRK